MDRKNQVLKHCLSRPYLFDNKSHTQKSQRKLYDYGYQSVLLLLHYLVWMPEILLCTYKILQSYHIFKGVFGVVIFVLSNHFLCVINVLCCNGKQGDILWEVNPQNWRFTNMKYKIWLHIQVYSNERLVLSTNIYIYI
jgi:hypothetical protein